MNTQIHSQSRNVNPAALAAEYDRLCEAEHDAALFGAGSPEYCRAYEERKRCKVRLHIARRNPRLFTDYVPKNWIVEEYQRMARVDR